MQRKCLLLFSLIPFVFDAKAQKSEKPNIIFFLMDDMGYGDIGVNGQAIIDTPNIDALAKAGKSFTQHYSGAPVSAPSRCTFLTGLHTGHSQIRGNDEMGDRGNVWSFQAMFDDPSLEGQRSMESSTVTIAHLLKDAGYSTACVGKWGLGYPNSSSTPNKMGFDYFYGYNCQRISHSYYPSHLYENKDRILLNNPIVQQDTRLDKDADPFDDASYSKFRGNEYAPDMMFEKTISFIDKNKNNPFFIWWTTPMPHAPMTAPKRLVDKYHKVIGEEKPSTKNGYYPVRFPRATYAAMVEYQDEQIGKIVAKLKEEGIYDNTIIVFTSDNGPSSEGGGDSPFFNSARPYKNEYGWTKGFLNEGGIRVPMIISWKNVIQPNTVSNHLSYFPDWMPTLCQIAGAKVVTNDGVSFVDELSSQKQQKHKYLYWEFPQNGGSIAVRKEQWKLIVKNISETPEYQLFDLSKDIQEENNLFKQHPKVAKELLELASQSHIKSSTPKFQMPLPFL